MRTELRTESLRRTTELGEFFSYGRQTAHYFDRPHESIPTGPIASDAAWRGPDLARSDEWRFVLDAGQVGID